MAESPAVKVAFVTCLSELAPEYLERVEAVMPDLPLYTVSEFPPARGRWIPYKPSRTIAENRARIGAALAGKRVRLSALVLDPKAPYGKLQWLAFWLTPLQALVYNENLDNFMIRPRCAGTIGRHFWWRVKAHLRWQLNPGGTWYTWAWRVRHPKAMRRPGAYWAARLAGWAGRMWRQMAAVRPDPAPRARPEGLSIVIPTRNGNDLVERLLASLLPQLPPDGAEVIVVDNGSEPEVAQALAAQHESIHCEVSREPLSFAAAVNRGIRLARYSHVCLLNNDMILEPGFFEPLRRAFAQVPDLFCATAQILFPPGMRRQETGKAVWYGKEDGRGVRDFPVRCLVPMAGEDGTWVLYGSGGCSLYDAAKLEQLGGFEERLAPAYVEDLDLGWRGWQRGWPTVYVAGARVTHFHRSTTSRYYKPELLQSFVEYNFLRFLARHVASPKVFGRLWRDAIDRLNLLAVDQGWFESWAQETLAFAPKAVRLLAPPPPPVYREERILAMGNGGVAVFPGRCDRGKPRILVMSPHLPYPLSHGGAVRIYNLMRVAAEEYDQILVAFVDELRAVPEPLLEMTAEVVLVKRYSTHLLPDRGRPDEVEEYDSEAMHAAIELLVKRWRPEVAQLEYTQSAIYAADCRPAKTVLVEHDITFDLQAQFLEKSEDWETRRQYERWLRLEQRAWREVDAVAVMSEKDRRTVEVEVGAGKPVVLANGVDLERFRPGGGEPGEKRILFLGSFAHLPNLLAIDFFLRECWGELAALGAKLHVIAGSRHRYFLDRYQDQVRPALDQAGIEVEDFVADVRPAYERAAVVIAPLIASAGTNIKVMEAMAMGKVVVSTPAGINGLDLADGEDVLVTATGPAMTAAIRMLFADPEKRRAIEGKARARVERDFDWRAIGKRQAALYERLRGKGTA